MTGPHAHPFRFVDRVVRRAGDACTVVRVISAGERLQEGRGAADRPFPASLVFEALVQAALPLTAAGAPIAAVEPPLRTGGAPIEEGSAAARPGMIVAIEGARLHAPVWPGDRLRITATIVARFGGMIRVRSAAWLDEEARPDSEGRLDSTGSSSLVAEGEFTLAAGAPDEERR